MENLFKSLRDFTKIAGGVVNDEFVTLPEVDVELRVKLSKEELKEYEEAALAKDKKEIADALGDRLYLLVGDIIAHGLDKDIERVFNEIHRSNMSKFTKDFTVAKRAVAAYEVSGTRCHVRSTILEEATYYSVVRSDGKILKCSEYTPPNLPPIYE